jgi:hypothetical protein
VAQTIGSLAIMSRLFVALGAFALLAAACGDSGESSSESVSEPPPESSESECDTTPTSGAAVGEVLEIAVADVVVHVLGCVEYSTSPPAGGDHFGAWQNCGFYTAPLINEVAVHSLEHGAVWVTYGPDLDEATLEAMALRSLSESHLLVSPHDGLGSPIVLTAWGRQLAVESWDDPAVTSFLDQYLGRPSPTAPEPGVSCSGAIGDPPDDPTADYDTAFIALS